MAKRIKYENFTDLPVAVQDFFMDKADDVYDSIIKQHSLKEENFFQQVEDPILNCVLAFADIQSVPEKLKTNLSANNVSSETLSAIWTALLKNIFWPLRDFLGTELTDYLKQNNISTVDWPSTRVVYQPLSYTGITSEVINRLGLHSIGPELRKNLRAGIEKFHKNAIVADGLKEILIRLPEAGGLGLDEKTAEAAVEIIVNIGKSVPIMSEQEYEDYLNNLAHSINLHSSPDRVADAQEISTIRASMPAEPAKPQTELDKTVSQAYDRISEKPVDEYLARRLQNLISTRLRDVRNQSEVLSLLQRDTKVGGMSLDREAAKKLSDEIEAIYTEFRSGIVADEKKRIESQIAEQKRKIEERKREEAASHARWYQEKVKVKDETAKVKASLQAVAAGNAPVMQKSVSMEEKQFGPMVTVNSAIVHSPKSMVLETNQKSSSLATKQFNDQDSGLRTPDSSHGPIRVTAASADLMAKTPKSVDGVKAGAPQLQGLLGEIANMSLSSFRRLAVDPRQSGEKILERLDTLGQESFEQRVQGVRAWQQSPIMKMYFSLVSESFKLGQPLLAIAESKRAAGEDTLNAQEMEVLVTLNNKLHY